MLNFQQREKKLKKYLEILKKCPLFFGIDDDSLLRMLVCLGASVEFYDKKYTVFAEGSPAKYIGIVLTGSVHMIQVDYYGNRSILSRMGVSEVFCEAFACAESEAIPVSVIVDEPGEIMLIDCSHILHSCGNNCGHHQRLIYNLMKDLAEKTIMFHSRIEVTSKRTTRDKLLAFLMSESKRQGSASFEISFDRQELADYLEVDRSGLSAEISKMKKEGLIDCNKSCFKFL